MTERNRRGKELRRPAPNLPVRFLRERYWPAPEPALIAGRRCYACGHAWISRVVQPKQCPKCTSRTWWVPRERRDEATGIELELGAHEGFQRADSLLPEWARGAPDEDDGAG